MAGKRDFGVVIWKQFQDAIHSVVSEYIEENFDRVNTIVGKHHLSSGKIAFFCSPAGAFFAF